MQYLEKRLGITIKRATAPADTPGPSLTHTQPSVAVARPTLQVPHCSDSDYSDDATPSRSQPRVTELPPLQSLAGDGASTFGSDRSPGTTGGKFGSWSVELSGKSHSEWLVPTDTQYGLVWLPPPYVPPPRVVPGWDREEVRHVLGATRVAALYTTITLEHVGFTRVCLPSQQEAKAWAKEQATTDMLAWERQQALSMARRNPNIKSRWKRDAAARTRMAASAKLKRSYSTERGTGKATVRKALPMSGKAAGWAKVTSVMSRDDVPSPQEPRSLRQARRRQGAAGTAAKSIWPASTSSSRQSRDLPRSVSTGNIRKRQASRRGSRRRSGTPGHRDGPAGKRVASWTRSVNAGDAQRFGGRDTSGVAWSRFPAGRRAEAEHPRRRAPATHPGEHLGGTRFGRRANRPTPLARRSGLGGGGAGMRVLAQQREEARRRKEREDREAMEDAKGLQAGDAGFDTKFQAKTSSSLASAAAAALRRPGQRATTTTTGEQHSAWDTSSCSSLSTVSSFTPSEDENSRAEVKLPSVASSDSDNGSGSDDSDGVDPVSEMWDNLWPQLGAKASADADADADACGGSDTGASWCSGCSSYSGSTVATPEPEQEDNVYCFAKTLPFNGSGQGGSALLEENSGWVRVGGRGVDPVVLMSNAHADEDAAARRKAELAIKLKEDEDAAAQADIERRAREATLRREAVLRRHSSHPAVGPPTHTQGAPVEDEDTMHAEHSPPTKPRMRRVSVVPPDSSSDESSSQASSDDGGSTADDSQLPSRQAHGQSSKSLSKQRTGGSRRELGVTKARRRAGKYCGEAKDGSSPTVTYGSMLMATAAELRVWATKTQLLRWRTALAEVRPCERVCGCVSAAV